MNPFLALIAVAAAGLVLGVIMYVIAVHRVIDAPELSSLLATFSVNMMIIGLATTIFSTSPRNVDYSLGTFSLGPVSLTNTRLASAGLAVVITAGLYFFLYRTRQGRYVRAVAN